MKRILSCACGLAVLSSLAACGGNGELPPVFGAVFGVSGAATTPFEIGRIPERAVDPGDRIVGAAANNPGLCIWRDQAGRRFRAACPEGYTP